MKRRPKESEIIEDLTVRFIAVSEYARMVTLSRYYEKRKAF